MSKFLKGLAFTSVSLVALAATARGPVDGPTLSFGGSLQGTAVGVNQKVRSEPAVTFQTTGDLVLSIGGTTTGGLTYGGLGVLSLDRSSSASDRISEAYVYATDDVFGSVKLGDLNGVDGTMMYRGTDVLSGTGGKDAYRYFNVTRGVDFRTTIEMTDDTAPKLVYTSPTIHGIQFGASYTPDTRLYGRFKTSNNISSSGTNNARATAPYAVNHLALALSYNHSFSMSNLGLYGVVATGKGKNTLSGPKAGNVNSWEIGSLFDYKNYQAAAGYFQNNNSLMRVGSKWSNTSGYDLGLAYDISHNMNASVGLKHTERKVTGGKAKGDMLVLSMDYTIASGLVAFVEIDQISSKAPSAYINGVVPGQTGADLYAGKPKINKNNHGTLAIVGTKIRF